MRPWEKYGLPKPKSEASKGELSLADYEIYSGIELPDCPFVARLDGWGFHGLAKRLGFALPFDAWFAMAIAETAKAFFVQFNPALGYCFSDEINLVFKRPTAFKRIEKIDSIFAGLASTQFQAQLQQKYGKLLRVGFDCRCIPLDQPDLILKYLIWRQAECFRNHNNAWAHWLLMRQGMSARAATKALQGLKTKELLQLCSGYGIDLTSTEQWQRNGIAVVWQSYEKAGWDPKRQVAVKVLRRRPVIELKVPLFKSKAGKAWLEQFL